MVAQAREPVARRLGLAAAHHPDKGDAPARPARHDDAMDKSPISERLRHLSCGLRLDRGAI
jgi:hypothetical protein